MDLNTVISQKIDWDSLPVNELKGERGKTLYREITSGGFRIRMAEYSANYKSAKSCAKGHIIHCISGLIDMHLKNSESIRLTGGDSILLKDGDSHTATTENNPAVLFIIDKE
jgi:hypothetical protein